MRSSRRFLPFPPSLLLATISALGARATSVAMPQDAIPEGRIPLVCAESEVDFGEVDHGQRFEHVYTLVNEGSHPVTIRRVGITCECGEPRLFSYGGEVALSKQDVGATHLEIEPGEKARILLKIDSTGEKGNVRRKVLVYTDSSPQPLPLVFSFKVKPGPETGADSTGSPPPRIEFDAYEVDFGELLAGEKKRHTYKFRNTGEGPLRVTRVRASCGCTVPRLVSKAGEIAPNELDTGAKSLVLAPGEEAELEVEFNSTGRAGKITKKIDVHSNDATRNPVVLSIKGECRSAFELNPSNFYFSYPVMRRHAATRSVTFKPTQMPDCRIIEVVSPVPYITVAWSNTTMKDVDGQVAGPPTFKLDVTISEAAPLGPITQAITVKTNNDRLPSIQIPVRARVTPEVAFLGPNPRNPESLEFGMITLEKPVSVDMEIVNHNREVPYTIDRIAIDSKEKEHLEAKLITLEEGVKYILRVTAKETLAARFFRGTVRLESHHPDLELKEISFQGWVKPN
ncbi:MAG: DUF1573 domain-containing protein [Planctomycetota bacterium]